MLTQPGVRDAIAGAVSRAFKDGEATTADVVGGGAMIVGQYGVEQELQGLPTALRSTETAFGEVRMENESAIQNAKTGATPSSCVKPYWHKLKWTIR